MGDDLAEGGIQPAHLRIGRGFLAQIDDEEIRSAFLKAAARWK